MDDADAIAVGLNDAEFLLRASGALDAVVVVDVDVSFSGIGLFRFSSAALAAADIRLERLDLLGLSNFIFFGLGCCTSFASYVSSSSGFVSSWLVWIMSSFSVCSDLSTSESIST